MTHGFVDDLADFRQFVTDLVLNHSDISDEMFWIEVRDKSIEVLGTAGSRKKIEEGTE